MDAMSIALSGMKAAKKRLETSANNVANANTQGYKAQETSARENPEGGVIVDIRAKNPPTVEVPAASGNRTETLPNVSLDQEAASQVQAQADYQANIRVIQARREMDGALLDIQA